MGRFHPGIIERMRRRSWWLALIITLVHFLLPATAMSKEPATGIPQIRVQEVDTPLPRIDESRFVRAPVVGTPLREPDMVWVEAQLADMTLAEKVGQMLMTSQSTNMEGQIDNYKVGGFIFIGNGQSAQNIVDRINGLQNYAPRPLWFSIDSEAGLGARVSDATVFPLIMALGAADDPALAEQLGRVTARESQSLGIQIAFGPVVDANTEPINPIISTRSASDKPNRITRTAKGFITGARAEGVLCTFKHYPGHGATAGDSHSSLPAVHLSMAELRAVHLKPYFDLAASGDVDMVMTAHVWFSQVHPGTPWPATLSSIFNTDILRGEIGYQGILISDAYNMGGLVVAVPDAGERAVVGIESGLDIILDVGDMASYHMAIMNAVATNRLTTARIDESVRRILIAKSRAGLPERTTVDPTAWTSTLNAPEHREVVRQICQKAFTRGMSNLADDPPVARTENILLLALSTNRSIFYRYSSDSFRTAFETEVPATTFELVSRTLSESTIQGYLAQAASADKVIVLGYDWYDIYWDDQVELINRLAQGDKPVIYVSFGAPYHYLQIPGVDAFYCGYASVPQMQETAVEVLLGDRSALGRLPVDVEGLDQPGNDRFVVY